MMMLVLIFVQIIFGDYLEDDECFQYNFMDGDFYFKVDYSMLIIVFWESDLIVQLIYDVCICDGVFVEIVL